MRVCKRQPGAGACRGCRRRLVWTIAAVFILFLRSLGLFEPGRFKAAALLCCGRWPDDLTAGTTQHRSTPNRLSPRIFLFHTDRFSFKLNKLNFLVAAVALALAGCGTTGGGGNPMAALGGLASLGDGAASGGTSDNRVGAAMDLFKAATVSEAELKAASLQMRAAGDAKANVASGKNRYAQRLERLTRKHTNEDGMVLNYKVYLSPQVNANAPPDGSVRVYSGLMDRRTDAELLGVIGHEIGHAKLGHSLSAMRTSYLASAGRNAASSAGGVGRALATSQLGDLSEKFLNSQFSQSQETASDDYGVQFLKRNGYETSAMASGLRKLAALNEGKSSAIGQLFSSHPEPNARAARLEGK